MYTQQLWLAREMNLSGLCSDTERVEPLTRAAEQGEQAADARESLQTNEHNVTLFLSPHTEWKAGVEVENGLFIRQLASHCLGPADFDGPDETNGS